MTITVPKNGAFKRLNTNQVVECLNLTGKDDLIRFMTNLTMLSAWLEYSAGNINGKKKGKENKVIVERAVRAIKDNNSRYTVGQGKVVKESYNGPGGCYANEDKDDVESVAEAALELLALLNLEYNKGRRNSDIVNDMKKAMLEEGLIGAAQASNTRGAAVVAKTVDVESDREGDGEADPGCAFLENDGEPDRGKGFDSKNMQGKI
ncbi:hypothetical protein IFR05_012859 [Cadophora sp. M221]|nr:hypothetical protein IFR05_012859 [Cadophora sp. M221]